MMIYRMAARLHDENVRAAHIFQNLIARFAVGKLAVLGASPRHAQIAANRVRQSRIRSAAENFEFLVDHRFSLSRTRANLRPGDSLPWIEFQRRIQNLPGTLGRLGAPALGFGRLQTPPTRYPPARHLRLLA